MNIIKNLVPSSKYSIKCPYTMTPKGICVHNSANDASAKNEVAYMVRNDYKISFHYAIDDKEVVQGIPENRNAYHAGDGSTGKGNREYIGVEICYSKSGGSKFVAAEKNAAKFIASKLKEKGWDISHVKKHQDFSGKYCPHRTLDMGWQRFLDMIQSELSKLNEEEKEMTKEERIEFDNLKVQVKELREKIEELTKVYKYWKELPKWALRPMYAAYKAKLFVGASPGNLNVTLDMIRTVVMDARLARLNGKISFKDDTEGETKQDILKELGIE